MLLTQNQCLFPLGWYPSGDFSLWTVYTSKKRRVVLFLRTKPKDPPSILQSRQRDLWTGIVQQWTSLPQATRDAWQLVATRCHIRITALNLYVHCYSRSDFTCLATLARSAGVSLASLL